MAENKMTNCFLDLSLESMLLKRFSYIKRNWNKHKYLSIIFTKNQQIIHSIFSPCVLRRSAFAPGRTDRAWLVFFKKVF